MQGTELTAVLIKVINNSCAFPPMRSFYKERIVTTTVWQSYEINCVVNVPIVKRKKKCAVLRYNVGEKDEGRAGAEGSKQQVG